jgi:hypothetical protein
MSNIVDSKYIENINIKSGMPKQGIFCQSRNYLKWR